MFACVQPRTQAPPAGEDPGYEATEAPPAGEDPGYEDTCVYHVFIYCRFGVTATEAEMNVIWESLLKNKNGTTNFHEFLRQFASRPATTACKTTLAANLHPVSC